MASDKLFFYFKIPMNYCIICNDNVNDDNEEFTCTICSRTNCSSCTEKNGNKCCFCNSSTGELEREIENQFSLLAITKLHLISSFSDVDDEINDEKIKPCPVCGIFIEKEKEDCSQIYCTICKSAWCWKTMKIVVEKKLIHNPHYFDKQLFRNYSVRSRKRKLALKCLKRLDEEEYTYASDTYMYKVNFITEQINVTEFKKYISERFKLRKKHLGIADILTKYLNKEITRSECESKLFDLFDATLKPGHLPYV